MFFAQTDLPQNSHKYVVREAWQYLKIHKPSINWDATDMASHIGNDENGDPEAPWDERKVVIGSYREDEEDPVYN